MKITKQRLKEIIREELNEANRFPPDMTGRAAHSAAYGDDAPSLGDLQSDEKFTGGTPKEQMIRRIKARELLAAMSREELKDFAMSLDADMVAELRHLLANRMYAPVEESDEMELEEAASWDKEALKARYPGDRNAHAVIDKEHAYGTERHKVMAKLTRVGGDPSKSPYGSSR